MRFLFRLMISSIINNWELIISYIEWYVKIDIQRKIGDLCYNG